MMDNKGFLRQLKKAERVVAYVSVTNNYIRVTKKSALQMAQHSLISYYISEDIYAHRWRTIVIV